MECRQLWHIVSGVLIGILFHNEDLWRNSCLSIIVMCFSCTNFSNNSIEVLVSFIERSSSIQPVLSPPNFKMPLYIGAGSKWMKGKWEIILLLHICWCPPKGICHAGNDIKIIPSGLMYLGRFDRNVALSFICSITSWQMIKSNLCSSPFNLKISEAMKFPFICL